MGRADGKPSVRKPSVRKPSVRKPSVRKHRYSASTSIQQHNIQQHSILRGEPHFNTGQANGPPLTAPNDLFGRASVWGVAGNSRRFGLVQGMNRVDPSTRVPNRHRPGDSLGTAGVVIWLILTVVYRSIRVGLISLVPNLFPLVATGTILYFSGQYLEMVTVCVFTICIGVAVDDTIHFLTRYAEEDAATDNHQLAIERDFTGVGSALLMTTIVLVTGRMTAVFGDARDARLFGVMGAMTLASALFADDALDGILFRPCATFGGAKGDAS